MRWILAAPTMLLALVPTVVRGEPAAEEAARKVVEHVDLYGRAASHLSVRDQEVDLRNNGSRFGIRADAPILGAFTVHGRFELAVKLGDGDESLNLDSNTGGELGRLVVEPTTPGVRTRLGQVGLDFHDYGRVDLGKQKSVYRDVTDRTDVFSVFGQAASFTYPAGTDGGDSGSGRANNALVYRLGLGAFSMGVQTQLGPGGEPLDGVAASVGYRHPSGLSAGLAYNHRFIAADVGSNIDGYDGLDARALAAVLAYDGYGFGLSVLYARGWDHEGIFLDDRSAVLFGADGVEATATWTWRDLLRLAVGYNGMLARDLEQTRYGNDYAIHDAIVGLRAYLAPYAWLYAEGRFPFARDQQQRLQGPAGMLGMRFDFSTARMLAPLLDSQRAD